MHFEHSPIRCIRALGCPFSLPIGHASLSEAPQRLRWLTPRRLGRGALHPAQDEHWQQHRASDDTGVAFPGFAPGYEGPEAPSVLDLLSR